MYQAFLTSLKILTGLIVLNEIQYYTLPQLGIVFLCATLIVFGILVNLSKSAIFTHSQEKVDTVSSETPLLNSA